MKPLLPRLNEIEIYSFIENSLRKSKSKNKLFFALESGQILESLLSVLFNFMRKDFIELSQMVNKDGSEKEAKEKSKRLVT